MNTSDRNLNNDSANEQQEEAPRPNSLKNRIKQRAMAMDCDTDPNEVHISSVLAAASALASLGNQSTSNTPPSTPENTAAAAGDMKLTLEQMMAVGSSQAMPRDFDQDVPMTFPQKLMEILDNSHLTDIVTWLPNGKGFIILQKRRFATEVMPMYFKHSKFTSFTRKLNRWGFTRVTRGPESGAYYHKYFQRGQHNLVMQMHCQSKMSSKDNAPVKESTALSAIKSPGVSSAMSALQLDESPAPNAAAAAKSFSTSNPNIFAPDLTRRDDTGTPKADLQASSSGIKRPFDMNSQQKQTHDEQALRMLNNYQEMLRQQISNSQRVFSHNTFQLSRLDPRFHQSKSFGYDRMSTSSTRKHPFVIQAAMNAIRHPDSSGPRHSSDPVPQTTLMRQQNDVFTALKSRERASQRQMTDQDYLNMMRAKDQSESCARFVSILGTALGTPAQTREMIDRALQDQWQNFEERQRKEKEAKEETPVTEAKPVSSDAKPAAVKSSLAMTQKQVANLHDMTKSGQAKSAKDRYPKTVRRASAA